MKHTMIWDSKNFNTNLKKLEGKINKNQFISQEKVKSMSFQVVRNKLQ